MKPIGDVSIRRGSVLIKEAEDIALLMVKLAARTQISLKGYDHAEADKADA